MDANFAINWVVLTAWLGRLLPMVIVFVLVMLLDLLGGVIVALRGRTFKVEKLPEFLQVGLLYLWAWLSAEILALLPALFALQVDGWAEMVAEYAPDVVYGYILVAKYGASIIGHISAIKAIPHPVIGVLAQAGIPPTAIIEDKGRGAG